jgi:hypothetical protein
MVFKACVRCRGDLYREDDLGHVELVCLQCGCRLPAAPVSTLGRLAVRPRVVGRKRATQPMRAAA